MHHRTIIVLAAALAAVLVVAGCGGDDEDSAAVTVTTSSLTKAQFVAQAVAICESERKKLPQKTQAFTTQNPAVDTTTPEGYTEGVKAVIVPTVEAEIVKISDLGSPENEEERVMAMLTAQQEAVEEVAEGDVFGSSNEFAARFTPATKQLNDYGLERCAIVAEPYRAAAGLPKQEGRD